MVGFVVRQTKRRLFRGADRMVQIRMEHSDG